MKSFVVSGKFAGDYMTLEPHLSIGNISVAKDLKLLKANSKNPVAKAWPIHRISPAVAPSSSSTLN